MAMIDYGTLVKKNGKIINAGVMFMDKSDMGVTPVLDAYEDVSNSETSHAISKEYFAYVGDEELMICLYKNRMTFVSGNKYLGNIIMGNPWYNSKYDDRYTKYCLFNERLFNPFNCGINVSFETLSGDAIYRVEAEQDIVDVWDWRTGNMTEQKSYWKIIKDAYGLSDVRDFNNRKYFNKMCKNICRCKKIDENWYQRHFATTTVSDRYYVVFEYKGNTYEIVTGYGIDHNLDFYIEENMTRFGYTGMEQEFMKRFIVDEPDPIYF